MFEKYDKDKTGSFSLYKFQTVINDAAKRLPVTD